MSETTMISVAECGSFEAYANEGTLIDVAGEGVGYSTIQPHDLIRFCRTVAALTAENERMKSALERIAAPGFPSASDAMLQSKIARAALPHPCTCHPDDNPPKPCARRYAYSECVKAAAALPSSRETTDG